MLLSAIYMAAFLACGALLTERLLPQERFWVRLWAGMALGVLGMLWLPALAAFAVGFTLFAHCLALGAAALATAWVVWKAPRPGLGRELGAQDRLALGLALGLTLLTATLMATHYFWPEGGSLYVGQSTYGDLCLHAGIATGLAEQGSFPPQYTIYPGAQLSYPFLADALSASLLVLGAPLQLALLLPGVLMVFLLVNGFYILAYGITGRRGASGLATLLLFLNGGLGFAYFFDMIRANPEHFTQLWGYYQTPTNLVDNGIVWVNTICDLLIPQRTLLFGWGLLMAALYFLYRGITKNRPRYALLAGIIAGAMPLVHTHSYLALGLVAFGWIFALYERGSGLKAYAKKWLWFALPAVLLALPQLLLWTFRQSGGFLRWHWDWSNQYDGWIWFWLKNLGLVLPLIPLALIAAKPRVRRACLPGFVIFTVAEVVLFQPNPYDNNKLFYIWYALMLIPVACYLLDAYRALRAKLRGTQVLAGMVCVALFLSAGLTIAQEFHGKHEIFTADEIAVAEYAREHTDAEALFLTADQHNNPLSTLAGRTIYCGTPVYLYFHGIDYADRAEEVRALYEEPGTLAERQEEFDYVLWSRWERDAYPEAEALLAEYPVCFQQGEVTLYAVSDQARARAGLS